MQIKHHEIEIPENDPFKNCKLERKQYADILTSVVKNYADGFVLAINNEWGTGKTTFVKMWEQRLKNEGFQTIYLNAWENDFDNNPLVAIMSELNTLTNAKNEKVFKTIVEKGAMLTKNVLPTLLKAIVKKYIDIDSIVNLIEKVTEGATEILTEEIKEYTQKKKSIADFRKELEKFIGGKDAAQPLIFIIDELDRCRPHYAVELLEQLKHFFSVSGIVFVLSIDKNHLAASVRGFYGSENINTDEYLRRFIDLEYSIPAPSSRAFCGYLFEYYAFEEFFSMPERRRHREFNSDAKHFLHMAELLFNKSNATLRQQEKIFGQSRLILKSFYPDNYIFSFLLLYLVFIKVLDNELYKKIESKSITLQELSDAFVDALPKNASNTGDLNLYYVQAFLLVSYNNSFNYQERERLFIKDDEGNEQCTITSKFPEHPRSNLADSLKHIGTESNTQDIELNYLLNKINLTEMLAI